MATTTYTIATLNADTDAYDATATRSNKAAAISVANATRVQTGCAVRVTTNAGTIVFEMDAPTAKATYAKPYFRTIADTRPANAVAPAGWEVCYDRARRDVAVIRNVSKRDQYAVMRISTGDILAEATTTREAGQIMKGYNKIVTPVAVDA